VELFNPVNVSCKRLNGNPAKKNYWKPSKAEIKQGFICYANVIIVLSYLIN